ncbi:hypothetical protein [Bradyrhizobium sp. Bra64]|uniref:hypothetical protein n=1 Tax=Bradyrhizobium sp. Bra64 TaxID=2926009 RepID=UPI002118C7F0|nr:hypothetical protein [Bradyrhizobium sp. Bra64]
MTQMENPALAARGVPNADLLAGSITSETTSPLRRLQASRLARLYAVNAAMAEIIAPLVFLEVMR